MTIAKQIAVTEDIIGPAEAKAMLDKLHPGQRSVSEAVVKRYASSMRAGTWDLVPHGLVFDAEGHLVDGQHRLLAVVESGTEQMFTISTLPPGASTRGIDRGKSRTQGHVMEMTGLACRGEGRVLAACCRALYALSIDVVKVPDFESVMGAVVENNGATVRKVIDLFEKRRDARSWTVAPLSYAYPCDPEKVESLVRLAVNNDRLVKFSAPWHLQRQFSSLSRSSVADALENSYRVLRVVQLHFEGGSLNEIRSRPSGKGNEIEKFEPTSLAFFKKLRKAAGLKETVI